MKENKRNERLERKENGKEDRKKERRVNKNGDREEESVRFSGVQTITLVEKNIID